MKKINLIKFDLLFNRITLILNKIDGQRDHSENKP